MKKRIICFLLAMILALGAIPAAAIDASAASERKTSTKAIEVLMEMQGFKNTQYEKNGKFYIGYGTEIEEDSYPNGITKEKAIELVYEDMSGELNSLDDAINAYTKKNNLDLTQYQHDALALFSYRKGTDWLTDTSHSLYEAVRTGKTANTFLGAIGQHHGADISDLQGLKAAMNERLSEANMYLNNSYAYNAPSNFTYSIMDVDGNEQADDTDTLIVYNTQKGYNLSPLNDPDFMGWYVRDSKVDGKILGEPITKLTADTSRKLIVAKLVSEGTEAVADYKINTSSLESRKLFSKAYSESEYKDNISEKAIDTLKSNTTFTVTKEVMVDGVKWAYGSAKNEDDKTVKGWVYIGKLKGVSVSEPKPIASATVTSDNLNIRAGATKDSDDIGDLKKGTTVNIYEIKVEKTLTGNQSWGKVIVNGVTGWINLAYTEVDETMGKTDSAEGETGKIVNTANVNVRKDPEIKADNIIAMLARGTKVTILETKMNGAAQWGKVRWTGLKNGYTEGWVYMYYVELDDAPHSDPDKNNGEKDETILYTGVVTSNINLNVRKSADIYADKVDSLPTGTKINIYETKTSRNMQWGKIGSGRWVCLNYVSLTKVDNSSSNSATSTTTSTRATVTSATLDVMQNYNSNAEKVGTLKKGDVVTILEKNTESTGTGSRIWGRISKDGVKGWINLAYVELKTVTSVTGGSTGSSSSSGTNANGAAAVISNCISVNVREAAGVANAQITKLKNGTSIKVYNQVTKDNAPWAKITWNDGANEGWVCMNYVTMSSTSTGTTTEGGLVNGTNSNTISATGIVNSNIDLNVRSGAGLGYAKIGSMKKGTRVTVYEQVSADGMIWGRTPYGNGSGWICMSYISIESASSTGKGVMGTVARCFAAVNVRSAPGTNNALINKINVGTRVEVFETKQHGTQLWGRVAQGWVCMDYILLDSELPPGTVLDAPTTAPSTEAPTDPEETINRDNEVLYTINGKVIADPLNVRNDADVESDKVGTVKKDLEIKILALKNNGAELWGRIDQYATAGWVNMDYVDYSVVGFVNTDDQPVYANADTSSTVKDNLSINTKLTITKLTVGGETVYGWVDSASGWIPMGRISDEEADVIPTYKKYTNDFANGNVTVGNTNTASDVVSEINGSKVVFKVQSGVKVPVGEICIESGIVWGKLIAHDVEGWINMAKVNYTLTGTIGGTMNVRSSKVVMDDDDDETTNILGTVQNSTTICELSFDGDGNLWGKVTGYTNGSGEAVANGGYIMVREADGTEYVAINGIRY